MAKMKSPSTQLYTRRLKRRSKGSTPKACARPDMHAKNTIKTKPRDPSDVIMLRRQTHQQTIRRKKLRCKSFKHQPRIHRTPLPTIPEIPEDTPMNGWYNTTRIQPSKRSKDQYSRMLHDILKMTL
jgi:hypothetical protein